MDKLALARLDVIEAQIRALEIEYRQIYEELISDMRPMVEFGSTKFCEECCKTLPIEEFYCSIRHGRKYYMRKCKTCEKIHRNIVSKGLSAETTQTSTRRKSVKVKRNYDQINDLQNEAAAHGMSYGQWVAQQYMRGNE